MLASGPALGLPAMSAFTIITFGCQMNSHDSERIRDVLLAEGHREASGPADADIVLLNTCSVREKAEQKLRSEVGRLLRLKRERPHLVLGVAGCVAQQEKERLLGAIPGLDLVVGPDNISSIPGLLRSVDQGGPPQVLTEFDLTDPTFLLPRPVDRRSPAAYVTTMKGCDERCAFCIVPTTRGPERYRPSGEVIEEIRMLVDSGVREVTLLGQTVNSYRDPSRALPDAPASDAGRAWGKTRRLLEAEDSEFAALLRAVARSVPRLERVRYTSPHPRHLTPQLIRAHAELRVLPRHVHLPVQSGSDRVLKRMIRRYTVGEYTERVDALRAHVPDLTLSTDVIVGFPGETREDFQKTLELVARIGFTGLFGFKYSPRPGTPATRMADDVPEDEKSARLGELLELSNAIRQTHLRSLVGSRQNVLVEGVSPDESYTGRTERNEIVHFGCTRDVVGEVVPVTITRAFKNSLAAETADPALAAALPRARTPAHRRALPVL